MLNPVGIASLQPPASSDDERAPGAAAVVGELLIGLVLLIGCGASDPTWMVPRKPASTTGLQPQVGHNAAPI